MRERERDRNKSREFQTITLKKGRRVASLFSKFQVGRAHTCPLGFILNQPEFCYSNFAFKA